MMALEIGEIEAGSDSTNGRICQLIEGAWPEFSILDSLTQIGATAPFNYSCVEG